MREKIKTLLTILAFSIPFGFASYFFFGIFQKTFESPDIYFMGSMLSGFTGAFFAFLFVRLGDGLTRIYDRAIKNVNALVKLQHVFNDILSELNDNVFVAEQYQNILSKSIDSKTPIIAMNRFYPVTVDKQTVMELSNIDLINEINFFYADIQKFNKSAVITNDAYVHACNSFIDKKITLESYLITAKLVRDDAAEAKRFVSSYMEDGIRLLAKIRILSKEAPLLLRIIRAISRTRYPSHFDKLVDKEMAEVNANIENTKNLSREKINKVVKN